MYGIRYLYSLILLMENAIQYNNYKYEFRRFEVRFAKYSLFSTTISTILDLPTPL